MKHFPEGRFIYPNIYVEENILRWRANHMAIPPDAIPEQASPMQKFFTLIAWHESEDDIWGNLHAYIRDFCHGK